MVVWGTKDGFLFLLLMLILHVGWQIAIYRLLEKKGLHMSIWHMYSCHGSTLLQPTSHDVDVVVVAEVVYCSLIAD